MNLKIWKSAKTLFGVEKEIFNTRGSNLGSITKFFHDTGLGRIHLVLERNVFYSLTAEQLKLLQKEARNIRNIK